MDFLTSPVPILEDFGFDFTPLEIARGLGYATEVDYIEAVAQLISVSNSVPQTSDQLLIPLGGFRIVDQSQHSSLRFSIDRSKEVERLQCG